MLLCSQVSKHHATAQIEGGVVVLRELGSVNGTFVNGVPVRSQATLAPGDLVQISDFVLSFEAGRPEVVAPADLDEPTSTGLKPSLGEAIAHEGRLAEALTRRLRAEGLSREAMLRVVDAMVDLLAGGGPHANH
jgi:pSer/pThr/pTyr-binding forkhead associated (FHA) protein